jgi:hypothetical protein
MLLVHLCVAIATLLSAFLQQIDFQQLYSGTIQSIHAVSWPVYAWVMVICCLLVLVNVILEQLKFYGLMSLLSRLVFELSLLGMSLLSFWSIFFGWRYLKNLWFDMIPMVFLPYLGCFVALVMIQLFDFNYPYKKRVAIGILLSIATFLLVFMHVL